MSRKLNVSYHSSGADRSLVLVDADTSTGTAAHHSKIGNPGCPVRAVNGKEGVVVGIASRETANPVPVMSIGN